MQSVPALEIPCRAVSSLDYSPTTLVQQRRQFQRKAGKTAVQFSSFFILFDDNSPCISVLKPAKNWSCFQLTRPCDGWWVSWIYNLVCAGLLFDSCTKKGGAEKLIFTFSKPNWEQSKSDFDGFSLRGMKKECFTGNWCFYFIF